MLWIHTYPSEDIPEYLQYDGWKTDRNNRGQTPLMIWIDYSKDDVDDVPECLLYPGCQTDKDKKGKNIVSYWIEEHRDENIPKEL